ncbi:GTPase Era, mitochondrial [Clupea harengus]|uniref:GTPase Era, mitochondrial n=1 Tax=Clupea harengus TaxID=7950 RepID=A0A8M1K9F4_CLUHA|nr:GTPase Era, mitochondrial [Clupea harengus]
MALRVCHSAFRKSLCRAINTNFTAPLENASPSLRTGSSTLRLRTNRQSVFHFTPACYIASGVILDRLAKGKAPGTDDGLGHRPTAVPPEPGEHLSLLLRHPDQPENPRLIRVAVVGAPNAGKSTLTNQLLGRKVFAVSKKVHTTRSLALGVFTEDDTQIILLDTPGLTTPAKAKRHQLEDSLLVDPSNSLQEADLVVVLVDVSDKWTRNKLDFEVLKCLAQNPHIPAVLVLNKVDLLKGKNMLLDITAELTEGVVNGRRISVKAAAAATRTFKKRGDVEESDPADTRAVELVTGDHSSRRLSREEMRALRSQRGWSHFKDVFMVSALDGEDVETLMRYFMVEAKPGSWLYHSEVLTDQSPEDMCRNAVREKLLEYLSQEVPYTMTQHIELWKELESGALAISVKLHVMKESHMKMVIGAGGQLIAKIAREAGEDLTRVFLRDVQLKITAKVKN